MKVSEIFTSIQGESSYAGVPCTFIRLSGCNLRCFYCDTAYAYDSGMELTEDEIINEVSIVGVNLVEITGGEPLLQEGVFHLIERLLNDGHLVLIETNGSMSIKDIDPRAVIVLDIKTPQSGMAGEMDLSNLDFLKPKDEVKFVIVDRADYEWAREFISKYSLRDKCKVLFSPAFEFLGPKTLAEWILEDRLDVRLNLQIHKYIFGAENNSPKGC
ncbi:MAG: radical SAM protein [Thermodesulfovibrionales bacterium]|nr:radical SAM protein [Thermodesulfovibrionales bacterium]